MKLPELRKALTESGVSPNAYNIEGVGVYEDRYCLEQRKRNCGITVSLHSSGRHFSRPRQTFLYLLLRATPGPAGRPLVDSVWVDVVVHAASNRIQQRRF
jgi:hypothetical protein